MALGPPTKNFWKISLTLLGQFSSSEFIPSSYLDRAYTFLAARGHVHSCVIICLKSFSSFPLALEFNRSLTRPCLSPNLTSAHLPFAHKTSPATICSHCFLIPCFSLLCNYCPCYSLCLSTFPPQGTKLVGSSWSFRSQIS